MKFLSSEKLSEHKYKTPEGYLVCVDAILARTGTQEYRKNEVFADSDDDSIIKVDRRPEEVFSAETLASFENKPITVEHPDENVNTENYKDYSVGFVRDVKRGVIDGQDVMLGTLVITDEQTIEEIENGEHIELSCGYDCDIVDEENPQQRNIRGNHVALCEQGRAGIARIVDSVKDANRDINSIKEHFKVWGYPSRNELQGIVNFYKLNRAEIEKIFENHYDKSDYDKLIYKDSVKDSLTESDLDIIDDAIRYVKLSHKPLTIENIIYQLNLDVQGFIGNNMSNIIKYLKEVKHIRDSKFNDDGHIIFIKYIGKDKKEHTWKTWAADKPEALNQFEKGFHRLGIEKDDIIDIYDSIVRDVNPHECENFIEETKDDAPEPTKEMIAFIKNHSDIEEKVNQMLRQGIGFNEAVNYAYIEGKKKYKDSIKDVEPHEGEDKADFISRFMEETKEEYPDAKQRLAVAYNYWEKRNKKDSIDDLVKIYQYKVNRAIEIYGRIGAGLYDELDDNGLYVDDRNGKYIVKKKVNDSYFTENEKKDKEFVKNAIQELERYINNWNFLSDKQKREAGDNLQGLRNRIKELKESLKDSTKTFQIYYKDHNKTYINIVKAKSLDDAIKTHLKRSK